ncbi:MAG: hypothetical protein HYV90_00745 [Candidatus Woesebacteria bacterium]|nr:MAG: hypothetical protein HYV90_00745 [Candidatus Woesebacteria bacterium]
MANIEIETRQPNRQLNYVFGLVQVAGRGGRGQILHFGWDEAGYPTVVTNRRLLTSNAGEMERGVDPQPLTLTTEELSFTPVAFDFTEMSRPIDNRDNGNQFSEDVLSLACVNTSGEIEIIEVEELDLLKAILEKQINWGSGESESYSLIIPQSESQRLSIILFDPAGNPSNELAYRSFLLKVINALSEIDEKQNVADQKGYSDLVTNAIADAELNKIGDSADGRGKIANPSDRIAYLNLVQLRYLIQRFYDEASESFANGRRE